MAVMLLLGVVLSACSGSPPTVEAAQGLVVTRADGALTLTRATGASVGDPTASILLLPGDKLSTGSDGTATLHFTDGSIIQLGSASELMLIAIRSTDGVAMLQLLAGSAKGQVRSSMLEMQAYQELPRNFRMVVNYLALALHSSAGAFRLWLEGDRLQAVIDDGEFNVSVGNQQATLPPGWQAIAEPDKPLQLVSLITPTTAPAAATSAPTETPIRIVTLTPTPTFTPTRTPHATATATPTRTRVRPTAVPFTATAATSVDTPVPPSSVPPTEKPDRPPKPEPLPTEAPPPTEPPPVPTPS